LNIHKTIIQCNVVDDSHFPRREREFTIVKCDIYNEAATTWTSIHEPLVIWELLKVHDNHATLTFFKTRYAGFNVSYEMDIANMKLIGQE
jgi:hypothetical protein